MVTDRELVRRTLAGETEAFGGLVRRYQGAVYGLAFHRVGNFADAQDIAQDAFVKAFRKLAQLEHPERFAAWLNAIAANECRMWLRRRREAPAWEDIEAVRDPAAGADDAWVREELRATVAQALGALPEKSRLVLTLHYLSGLSYQEIGEFLGVSVTVVDGRLHRARRQLREEMTTMVEGSFDAHKLTDEFAEGVMQELSLTPDGTMSVALGEGVNTMILGAATGGKAAGMLALAMRPVDQQAILWPAFRRVDPAAQATQEAAEAKARAFDAARSILDAFDIRLKEVVLWLEEGEECRARVVLTKDRATRKLHLRPSDALALAARMKSPVFAEEPVMRQGKVGEAGLQPTFPESLDALREELDASSRRQQLARKAWELGLAPEEGRDTVRYQADEAAGALRIAVDGSDHEPLVLGLAEHRAAVEWLRDQAQRANYTSELHSDEAGVREYRTSYAANDGEVAVRFEPVG